MNNNGAGGTARHFSLPVAELKLAAKILVLASALLLMPGSARAQKFVVLGRR